MPPFIERSSYIESIDKLLISHPVVALLGPRQCGKTTIARLYSKKMTDHDRLSQPVHFFDLEDPRDLSMLSEPFLALERLQGLIIIDEIQRTPDLFPILRVLVDQGGDRQFLILGSASRDLIKQSSESLAGRIAYIDVHPFSFNEVDDFKRLHLLGGFPKSYLYPATAFDWIEQYVRTFLERDIPNLGFSIPPKTIRRFWSMLAHYHGNTFNASEIGRSLGISDHSAKHYLDILSGTFMVRQLQPWFENIGKRQTKKPKIYFTDSGLFHHLMDIHTHESLLRHPKLGASFEGFALEQVIRFFHKRTEDCYYWGIHGEAELDLFFQNAGKRIGFEFKYSDAPTMTPSMRKSLDCLNLDFLYVIYPGSKSYQLSDEVQVIDLQDMVHMMNP